MLRAKCTLIFVILKEFTAAAVVRLKQILSVLSFCLQISHSSVVIKP